MRRRQRLALLLSFAAASTLSAERARAVELVDIDDEPMTLDVTNTATFNWHFDNRNDVDQLASGQVDDNYGELLNKLNLQLYWWRLRAGLRFDTATFIDSTTSEEAKTLSRDTRDPDDPGSPNDRTVGYYRELHNRYLDTYYPSKLYVGYTQPGIDATVGDFYAQLGRGLVLSVRKIDEVAIDTTIRGGKLVMDHDFDDFRIGGTLLAGQLNPLRLDEPSGRRLQGDGSPLFFGFPKIEPFRYYGNDPNQVCPPGQTCERQFVEQTEPARPNYLEDTIFGARFEAGTNDLQLAANGSMLLRKEHTREYYDIVDACLPGLDCRRRASAADFQTTNPSRTRNQIRAFSGSVNVPSIAGAGDVYVEVAGQQLRDGNVDIETGNRTSDLSGYAVYANASIRKGPATVSLEGKHYRRFYPLSANIDNNDKAFGAPELNVVSYNSAPTVEPIYVEQIGSPNVCISGGWGNADYRLSKEVRVFGWLGYYVSFSEIDAGTETCATDDKLRTNTWDSAMGADFHLEGGKSHGKAWVGGRLTDREELLATDATGVFYREGYVRYDLFKHITGPFSLQMQGFHRHRYEPVAFKDSWNEGENYAALQWSPHFTAIVGYEYLGKEGCDPSSDVRLCHYVSGGLQWKSGGSDSVVEQLLDTVTVFVGQRRGAIRCVSGVCRQFPPFEGAKLELVSRF